MTIFPIVRIDVIIAVDGVGLRGIIEIPRLQWDEMPEDARQQYVRGKAIDQLMSRTDIAWKVDET